MPGYGLLAANAGQGLLPWSWAETRLREARNYWLASASETGRPHAMAVWGVWREGALWFSTSGASRKGRNLAHDARCVITTERADEAVVVEGRAERFAARSAPEEVPRAYEAKYAMSYPPDSDVYAVRPSVVFGWYEDAERFPGSATRWRF
jgi:pyridoxine/pyridoxamine 5'-phosphate oxidase